MIPDTIRDDFPIIKQYVFMNHAAVGPLPLCAVRAIEEYAKECAEHSFVRAAFYRRIEHVRKSSARLLGAGPEEITFIKNTSEGLSFVANGLDWESGDNVVTTDVEFPANACPWMMLEKKGVELRKAREMEGRVPTESILELIDDRTRVVTVSAVQYASGYCCDLNTIGEYCRSRGVFFCVDAIQALGVLPVDVRSMNIDFLSADGHKWLLGPEGLGIFYVRKELQDQLQPSTIGWMSMKDFLAFGEPKIDFHEDARRYDSGAYNIPGIYALGASIDFLMEMGIDKIRKRVLQLTDECISGLEKKNWKLISPRQSGESSGIVCFESEKTNLDELVRILREEYQIIVAARGGRLRVSPHVYNSLEEIQKVIDAIPLG